MSKHIWYSGATDATGIALAEALKITGTKVMPKNLKAGDLVIGWGAKTDDSINLNPATVWNHPNQIKDNRNKFATLQKLMANKQLTANIAKFCSANSLSKALQKGEMQYPLVGRTNFHQGGRGFWLCLNDSHIKLAIGDGAQYFQEFIDIADEYRLHVMFDEVAYAVRKTANPEEASWVAHQKEKLDEVAKKQKWNLNAATVDQVLGVLAKQVQLPDYIIRSNKRGWKFSSVKPENVNKALKEAALRAVATVGLQFGAVDCALDQKGNAYIIEINSGPGLQGTAKDRYVEIFVAKIKEFDDAQKAPAKKVVEAVSKVAKKVAGAVGAAEAKPAIDLNDEALVHMMNAVKSPAEARKILDLLIKRG